MGKGGPSSQYIKPISNDLSLKLFNLVDDPGERENMAETEPEKEMELEKAYKNWLEENNGIY